MINRYYDPTTGQFISVDPLVDQTGQAYAYTGDNPVNGVDPLGTATCTGWLSWVAGCGTVTDVQNAVCGASNTAGNWINNKSNTIVCNNLGFQNGDLSGVAGCGNNSPAFSVTCTFTAGGMTTGPYDWGNLDTLLGHFGEHRLDFGSQTPEEYAQQAQSFLRQMVQDGEIKVDPEDGAIRVYDPGTNTFGAYNPNGSSRTLFKPNEGESYWNKQPGEVPWFGGE